jgi:phosphatidylinositol kinase/protein kinase (PI-3  family)
VVPLGKDCGLVEWVNDTKVYREILEEIYRAKGIRLPVSIVFIKVIHLNRQIINTSNTGSKSFNGETEAE